MKLVEILKYDRSQKAGKDIEWSGAMQIWIDEGLAKKFADTYTEEISYKELEKQFFK